MAASPHTKTRATAGHNPLRILLALSALPALGLAVLVGTARSPLRAVGPVEVPVINGNLGPCSADFTVTDASSKPIYDAKIHVTILYGFMNKRKQDLEIGTNSDGKARLEGLPDKLKKPPLEFVVRSGDLNKTVPHDPAVDCHANFSVTLGAK